MANMDLEDDHFWRFEIKGYAPITEDQAKEVQLEFCGLSVEKYGFMDFEVTNDPVLLRYYATWKCHRISRL